LITLFLELSNKVDEGVVKRNKSFFTEIPPKIPLYSSNKKRIYKFFFKHFINDLKHYRKNYLYF